MHKRNAGKAVAEKLLFHGTSKQYVDAICQQNFDWRVCGLNGTVYGKGNSQVYSSVNLGLKKTFFRKTVATAKM